VVAKFGPIEKRIKKTDVIQDEISQKNSPYTLLKTKGIKEFWKRVI
jgi:hypothetical protein